VPLWLAAFVVLVIHGYLQHLSRPSEPTRDVIRGWLGEG
jgi:hypothetical protein